MVNLLIIDLNDLDIYEKILIQNLNHYNIPYNVVRYTHFNSIDFSKYSHIILTGSDYNVSDNRLLLSRDQIMILLNTRKPILAECYSFHLLGYYLCGYKDCVKTMKKKHTGDKKLHSPLVNREKLYFMNHNDYVERLDARVWDVISEKTIIEPDGSRITFILDAMMKHYSVLCIQYHPESSIENYDFIYKWIYNSFK
jgi:anthranilate/para-aminobenzoate synthase component II